MNIETASFIQRRFETVTFLAVYALLSIVWNLTGGFFRVWPDLWQLLPWPPLLDDLGRSLLDLHAQPPILNLVFGLALKAAVRIGTKVEVLLQPLYFAMGLVTVAAITAVAARIVPRPGVRRVVLLLLVLNPYFYAVHHYLFYTAWELFFLSLMAFLALRYFEHPTATRFATTLLPAFLLVYTRSLFHPFWFLFLLALLLTLGRAKASKGWRPMIVVSVAALLLIAAWPLKNLARFGFFGLSSWSGMSFARGLPTGEPLTPSGYPMRLAAFGRGSSEPLNPLAAAKAQSLVPPHFQRSPTLSELTKPDGSPNWNHYALIPISHQLGAAALEQLQTDPSLLFFKALDFYLNGFAIYEARWPYQRGFAPEMTTGNLWASAYEIVLFQRFRPYDPNRTTMSTGFAILFPIALISTGILLWHRRPWGTAERTAVLMFFTVLWVLALVLFVDGPEGNRVRFSTEPYLFLLVGWMVGNEAAKSKEPTSIDTN
jgi:hypothetical protein